MCACVYSVCACIVCVCVYVCVYNVCSCIHIKYIYIICMCVCVHVYCVSMCVCACAGHLVVLSGSHAFTCLHLVLIPGDPPLGVNYTQLKSGPGPSA